eukprot:15445512-Alexandrium_andersonii.AAC.1
MPLPATTGGRRRSAPRMPGRTAAQRAARRPTTGGASGATSAGCPTPQRLRGRLGRLAEGHLVGEEAE